MTSFIPAWFPVVSAILFGGIVGSFVNAAIHRLPRNISMLTRTRSFCPQCEHQLMWYDNVPLLSFLALRGRCHYCSKPIPARYFFVEVLTATLFAFASYQFFVLNAPAFVGGAGTMPTVLFLVQLFLIADLICITFTDLETWFIPVPTTLPWIAVGLILAPIFPEIHLSAAPWTSSPRINALIDSFQGMVIGAGMLWAIGFLCIVVLKKEGMGGGDIHLTGMIGALLGWKVAVTTIILACFVGSVLGISLMIWDRIQRARLGSKWKPRQPTFEMPDDDADEAELPDWPIAVMGLVAGIAQTILLIMHANGAGVPPQNVEAGPVSILPDGALVSTLIATGIACLLLLYMPVKKRMKTRGTWPEPDIRETEDGGKEEVMEGNYLPFGPSLALAGLIVVFYDPLIRHYMEYEIYVKTMYEPEKAITFTQYLLLHPLPFELLFV